ARVCQGRQGRLLLPKRAEVQDQVCDARVQRQGEPRRRHDVADRLRPAGADRSRRGTDRRAREEGGALKTTLATRGTSGRAAGLDGHDLIRVHGARENNLKDVSVEIPKRRLTVFTGVSGSGKSSLVFDT